MDQGQAAKVEPVCVWVMWQAVVGRQGARAERCLCALAYGAAPGANLGTPGMRDRTRSTRPENAAQSACVSRSERECRPGQGVKTDVINQARTPSTAPNLRSFFLVVTTVPPRPLLPREKLEIQLGSHAEAFRRPARRTSQ